MDQQRIGNRYELRRRIGAGGMSRVYLAIDGVLGREVAVKVLDSEGASDPAFVERFRREARAAASLNHPNVVAVFDYGELTHEEGVESCTYYLVMEYVPGGNLKDLVRRRGALPEEEALAIGIQIADALAAAHGRGIIHRDVKPHNVLLDGRGQVKVTDFGIAYAAGLSQLTTTNTVPGTAHYISPEQAQRQRVDARSDLYSLGVVLYELLTGQEPFRGASLVEVAWQHVHNEPVPPRRLRPEISPETQSLVLKALAKNPDYRYQSAAEMRAALERTLDHVRAVHAVRRETAPPPRAAEEETLPMPKTAVATRDGSPPDWTRRVPPPHEVTRHRVWLLAVPFLLVLLGVTAAALHARQGGSDHPVALARFTPTPTTQASTPVARTPSRPKPAVSRPTAAPTSTPPPPFTPTPLPAPAAAPTAAPTSTSPPPPAATATPVPAPTSPPPSGPGIIASAGSATGGPVQAVLDFYKFVGHHQFQEAGRLWTANMLSTWGYQGGIVSRFSSTEQITAQILSVRQDDANDATVAVGLWETSGNPPRTQHLVGQWQLVRGPSGWLLDRASF